MYLNNLQCTTPHKIKPGGGNCMTGKPKYKNILAVDTQSGCAPGQFLCGDRCAQLFFSQMLPARQIDIHKI